MKKRIIIDADMGSDDYIAVQMAILSKKFKTEGISLVFGNSSMDNVKKNLFKTLDMIGHNNKIKIYEGESSPIKDFGKIRRDNAFGYNGLGDVSYKEASGKIENKDAISWMIEKVNNNPNKISIIALGPLTNIAKAIKKDNNFSKNIKELIVMGGSERFGNITPYAEFNFYNDPEAVNIVYNSGIKNIITIGWNVAVNVPITSDYEEFLKTSNNKNANFLYDITRVTSELDKKYGGTIISDALTICYLLDKKSLVFKKANMTINSDDNDHLGESTFDYNEPYNCMNALSLDKKRVYKLVFNTLFPEEKKIIKKLLNK